MAHPLLLWDKRLRTMNEKLEYLLELQRIDDEIERMKLEQARIPGSVDAIEDRLREAKAAYVLEKEKLAALNKQRSSLENDLVLLGERLKKYQRQLLSAKTNQEYQAFLREIDATKANISKNEEDILTLMDEAETMARDIEQHTKELEEQRTSSQKEIESLKRQLSILAEQYEGKTDERRELARRMGSRLVSRYERIKNGRGGQAVAVINGEVCSGCHTTLPPQFAVEIRKGGEILTCENCGRILVWEAGD